MGEYLLTVTVELPDEIDNGPINTLSSIVLDCLNQHDIDVLTYYASKEVPLRPRAVDLSDNAPR